VTNSSYAQKKHVKERLITIAILSCCHINETLLVIEYILFEGHENKDVNSKKRTKEKLLPFFPNDVRKNIKCNLLIKNKY
jgi:hypothetical protein